MALCKSSSPSHHHLQSSFTIFQFFIFFILLLSHANAITFNFSSGFNQNENQIIYEFDAFSSSNVIQLTKNQRDGNLTSSFGRASFSQPVRLWDSKTRRLTDFNTHFSFIIKALYENSYGDGLAFFLVPSYKSPRPPTSVSPGGYLGLSTLQSAFNYTVNSTENAVVAVEFDSHKNAWDPSSDHVGINVNSIISKKNVTWKSSIKNGLRANAWVSYNSTTKNLSVFLSYAENPVFSGNSSLFHIVDLRDVLPEWVRVGFSASTGLSVEIHNILSWDFSSNLEISDEGRNNKSKTGLVVGLVVGFSVLFGFGVGLTLFFRRKKAVQERREDDMNADISMDGEFEKGTGAKRFSYDELARATDNFNEEGKLGEGGFGGVYKGYIDQLNLNIAVKRVSSGSKQGKKEYVSEVRIISRLRHRNLVQLIGWSHERGEFLLVYELMPKGSLDYHLFRKESMLTWDVRYKIALGLASALLYLHEEWEQCVVHRDIKSSNVMLDSSFNAKLGDFGLARLVDHHESGSQTTEVAGTKGYLAPECVTTSKFSKESDVYSFGIVALEIACGRRPVEQNKVNLVEWVWELYGKSNLMEAIDKRLSMDFVEAQTECLMVVGLWCAHPDHNARPSIRQVVNVLNFGSPLPILPSKLPTPVYFAPPMGFNTLLFSSDNGLTDSTDNTDTSSKFTMSSTSSKSFSSGASLLHSQANI